jgi:hypothetical protein
MEKSEENERSAIRWKAPGILREGMIAAMAEVGQRFEKEISLCRNGFARAMRTV